VPQRRIKEAHVLAVVNKGQNERKKTYFDKTKTNRGEMAQRSFKNASRDSFHKMKNQTMKNNPELFLEGALS